MADWEKEAEKLLSREWPIARYRFHWQTVSNVHFSEYAGSAIRGAFGRSLRKIACMTKLKECTRCPLKGSCPYTRIFSPFPPSFSAVAHKCASVPAPYIIEAPVSEKTLFEPRDTLYFDLVLFGRALNDLPLVVYAFKEALRKNIGHGQAVLKNVEFLPLKGRAFSVYEPEAGQIAAHNQVLVFSSGLDVPNETTIRVETFLRMQDNGRIVDENEITPYSFFLGVMRRLHLLMLFHSSQEIKLPFSDLLGKAYQVQFIPFLSWQSWIRFSSRQKRTMNLGGYLGKIEASGLDPFLYTLLQLGTYTHVGKNASFGLGKYSLL